MIPPTTFSLTHLSKRNKLGKCFFRDSERSWEKRLSSLVLGSTRPRKSFLISTSRTWFMGNDRVSKSLVSSTSIVMIHGTYLVSINIVHGLSIYPKAFFFLGCVKSLNFNHRFIENRGKRMVLLCSKGKETWERWEAKQDNGERILESNWIGS